MTTIHAAESFRFHMNRILSSVLQRGSVALYLCDTDRQDVALYHLTQAGGLLERYPDIVDEVAIQEETAAWLKHLFHMTVEERDDMDHVKVWEKMVTFVPLSV